MKLILILTALLATSLAHASTNKKQLCVLKHKTEVLTSVEDHARNYRLKDKFMHCSVSCILKIKCGGFQAAASGFVKEVQDLFDNVKGNSFGSGDLKADFVGLKFAKSSDTSSECMSLCQSKYP